MGFSFNKLRKTLFQANVIAGDLNAIQKGKIVERIARKTIWKSVGGFLSNLLK